MTDLDIEGLVRPILTPALSSSGLERMSVRSGEDYDGDLALFVDLFFEGRGRRVDHRALMTAMQEARTTIRDHGELRFSYMQLHIPDPDESLAA